MQIMEAREAAKQEKARLKEERKKAREEKARKKASNSGEDVQTCILLLIKSLVCWKFTNLLLLPIATCTSSVSFCFTNPPPHLR